ncbi:MAG TPA: NADH-quinone oxidoreductase subunit H [Candidatus Acidoferrum sp.]
MSAFLSSNAELIITLVKIALLLLIVLTVNAYLTWFERKVVAHMQSRWGPHRVGPHGLLQPLADGVKFLFKEDPTPAGADKFVYYLAPLLALALALTSIAIIPFGPDPIHLFGHDIYLGIAPPDLNIGILALFAITALGVYGIALAGWSSNSKYPLLGGLRSSAQMISYELSLTMSVVGVLLMAGSFNLKDIINAQAQHPERGIFGWNIWPQLLGFICFFIAAIAETNRIPFDLSEAESELVAGFHTEYASFKFAMFFIAEYTSMITVSCLCTIMFFGGWLSPFPASWTFTHYLPSAILLTFGLWVIWDGIRYETIFGRIILPAVGTAIAALGVAFILLPDVNTFIQGPFWLLSKIFIFLFIYVWMRGTLPRFRYDQLMAFGWKLLLPASIVNVIITSFVILAKMQWGPK